MWTHVWGSRAIATLLFRRNFGDRQLQDTDLQGLSCPDLVRCCDMLRVALSNSAPGSFRVFK